jgi:predicted permease
MRRRGFKRVFRFPFRRREDVRDDIREEFEFHLGMRTEELMRSGMDEAAARAQARREFGDRQTGEAKCAVVGDRIERKRRVARFVDELRQDVVFAIRQIASHRSFAAVAIATLAIGMTANMTIFAIVNALVFKPLPVAAPQSLARIKAGETQMAWANYDDIRRTNTVFSDLMAYRRLALGLDTGDRPVRVQGLQTSDNFFNGLGVPAALGRAYTPSDSRRDLIVLSDRLWRVRFGADRSVVGRVLTFAGRSYEVTGIMPSGFRGVDPPGLAADFWFPVDTAAPSAILRDRTESDFEVVGRLRSGATPAQAAAELSVLAQQIRRANPEVHEPFVRVSAIPVQGIRAFEGMARTLLPVFAFIGVMTMVSGLVLLIGCANIAGLLVGRAATRRHEIALRLALGAGRGRLVRQLLTESLVLAMAAGAVAIILVSWLAGKVNTLIATLPVGQSIDLGTDARVVLYAAALTIVTTVVFGLAPARGAARFDVVSSLKDVYGGSTARQRFRQMLVAGQVAASAALLIWTGLFVRSLSGITDVNPGFDPAGVLLASVTLERGAENRGTDILSQLQQRVGQSPNVESAGLAKIVPLSMRGREEFDMAVVDASGQVNPRRVVVNTLSPGWFDTVRIPLVAGRDFTWDDGGGAPRVAIVNETLARQFWKGAALDKQLFDNRRPLQVIGVVRDSKYWTIGETIAPTVYLPLLQRPALEAVLHIRTTDARAAGGLVVRELERLAPELAVEIEPMTDAVAVALLPARVGAAATAAFGSLAMFLSALGVYGLVAFVVVQRTREIGIRKALGAQMTDIVRAVVGDTARVAMTGLGCGLGAGLLGGLGLRGFMFGVSPFDTVTLVAAAAVVVTAVLLASAIPAMAAARVDPMITLRDV